MKGFSEIQENNTGPNTTVPLPDNIRILKRNLMAASWVSILSGCEVIEIAQGTQLVSGLAIKEGAIPWILLAVVVYLAVSYYTLYFVEYIKPGDYERINTSKEAFEGAKKHGLINTDSPRNCINQYYGKLSRFKTRWLNNLIPIGLSLIAIGCLLGEIGVEYLRLYIL